MTKKLFFSAMIKFLLGIILVGTLIFLPAGTINFFNGWLFMCILFIPMLFAGIIMMIKNPELLKKRLNFKEKQKEQGVVIKLSALMFIVGFVISGLNYRFKWHMLSPAVSISAAVVFLIFYLLYAEVLRENVYLSRTVEIQENQKVIDTGLYSVVRHPMYGITVFLFLAMPLILGSLISFAVFSVFPFIIVKRIINEEELLLKELKGYDKYMQKVKYKLIPFIW